MGYLVAALLLILAVAVAIAIAKVLFSALVIVAGIIGAVYVWRRLNGDRRALTS